MEQMPAYFRAVAIDYDGTLTHGPRPEQSVLAALARVRATSRYVILVTGRILAELFADFPAATQHFDAIVAENGAVVWRAGIERAVAPRVSDKLERALRQRGVALRRGTVIIALDAIHDDAARNACVELGLDAQLIRNREALMVLPAGISKSSGLREALADLGVSHHSAIGVGDAENDLALLDACEIGVAVENAVASLKEQADVVLTQRGPLGISLFLEHDVPSGLPGVQPRRRCVELGLANDGNPVTVPSSRIQLFIEGPTGAGKSYLAGLFAERLLQQGYAVCVIDPEGDHANLGRLRSVLTLGGREPLPPVEEVGRIIQRGFSSLVLDLSLREEGLKEAYTRALLDELTRVRRECGLPHWIVVEEAHTVSSEALDRAREQGSLCLVTYHPEWLPAHAWRSADVLLTVEGPTRARVRRGSGHADEVVFEPGGRCIPHVRHRRKYADGRVPYERGFTFRDGSAALGAHVASLAELSQVLAHVPVSSLSHHAKHRDFSRWIRDVFQDIQLATAVRHAEEAFRADSAEAFRQVMQDLIVVRYDAGTDDDIATQACGIEACATMAGG